MKVMKKKTLLGIITFYVIAITLRYLTNVTGFLDMIDNPLLSAILQGMGPAIGALVAVKSFDLKFSMTLKGVYSKISTPLIVFWIIPILLLSYTASGFSSLYYFLLIFVYGLLEEIGRRGFLQEQLISLPKFWSIFIVAVLWFVRHLSFALTVSNLIFFSLLFLGSLGIGYVGHKTKSLLVVAAFHSLNNFYTERTTLRFLVFIVLICLWVGSISYWHRRERNNRRNLSVD